MKKAIGRAVFILICVFVAPSVVPASEPADLPYADRSWSVFSGEAISDDDRDRYNGFLVHPLELNSASPEAMADLPFLSPEGAAAVYRAAHARPFSSTADLDRVIGPDAAERLKPFVTVRPPVSGLSVRLSTDSHGSLPLTNGAAWSFPGNALRLSLDSTSFFCAAALPRLSNGLSAASGAELARSAAFYAGLRGATWSFTAGGFRFRPLHGMFYSSSSADPALSGYRFPKWRSGLEASPSLSTASGSTGNCGATATVALDAFPIGGYRPVPALAAFAALGTNLTSIREAGVALSSRLPIPLSSASLFASFTPQAGSNSPGMLLTAFGLDCGWFPHCTLMFDAAYAGGFAVFPAALWKWGPWSAGFAGTFTTPDFHPPASVWNREEGFCGMRLEGAFRIRRFTLEAAAGASALSGLTHLRDRYELTAAWITFADEREREVLSLSLQSDYRGSPSERVAKAEVSAEWAPLGRWLKAQTGAAVNGKLETLTAGWLYFLRLSANPWDAWKFSVRATRFEVPAGGEPFTRSAERTESAAMGAESLSGSGFSLSGSAGVTWEGVLRAGVSASWKQPDAGSGVLSVAAAITAEL